MNSAEGLAFGGEKLAGRKLVRFVFLDEAGISRHEPYAVVAGVVVHGDTQVIPLEEHLNALIKKHIPDEYRDGFVFHATDIWSGVGPIFKDREKWPRPKRYHILHDLVRIPRRLEIPIVFSAIKKSEFEFDGEGASKMTPHQNNVGMHAMAFTGCTLRIEDHMREMWPTEIAQLVAEDNDQARAMIKKAHEVVRHPLWLEKNNVGLLTLPLTRIRGAVQFATKSESGPLQLADACAFFIRGQLSGHPDAYQFYKKLRQWMIYLPAEKPKPSQARVTFLDAWRVQL